MINHVLLIPGDGTGKETVAEGVKVLNAVAEKQGYKIDYDSAIMGGEAFDKATENFSQSDRDKIPALPIEEKRKLGLPQETIDKMRKAQEKKGAILFGAVGRSDLPKGVVELGLLHMRKLFDAVNNRPLIIDPILASQSILLRETPATIEGLTILGTPESLYTGEEGYFGDKKNPGHYTRKQFTLSTLEKFVKDAFLIAEASGQRILCASKYNVLQSEKVFSDTFERYAKEFAGRVTLNNEWGSNGQLIIDNAGMQLAKSPQRYNNTLVIADAMFADFLQSIADVITTEVPSQDVRDRIKQEGIMRIITRELCGGLYFGKKETTKEHVFDTMEYDRKTLRNLVDVAHRYGSRIGRANIDTVVIDGIPTFDFVGSETELYRSEQGIIGRQMTNREFVRILLTNPYLLNTPATTNMIGDIDTDLAAAIMGSLGLPPSSETNAEGFGNYQPIAGSAPDIAGKPLDPQNPSRGTICNPLGQIRSVAMMLEDHGDVAGAQMIYKAVNDALRIARTRDIHEPGYKMVTTQEMGDLIVQNIRGM